MIRKHESSTIVASISTEAFLKFFSDAMKIITKLNSLYDELTEFEEGEISSEDVYDVLDDFSIRISEVHRMSTFVPSRINALNKYLSDTDVVLTQFVENVDRLVNAGIYPATGDAGLLKKEIFEIIGGLTYFLVTDFGIPALVAEYGKGDDLLIDEILDAYVKENVLDVMDFCKRLLALYKKFKFRLDFFDEHSELEKDFELAVGPVYNTIPAGFLTVNLVKDVISGVISADELEDMIAVRQGGDFDA